jgi:hypothetical protein
VGYFSERAGWRKDKKEQFFNQLEKVKMSSLTK